jgi:hypothetical protein
MEVKTEGKGTFILVLVIVISTILYFGIGYFIGESRLLNGIFFMTIILSAIFVRVSLIRTEIQEIKYTESSEDSFDPGNYDNEID